MLPSDVQDEHANERQGMTAEELQEQLKNDLRIVEQYLQVKRRNEGRSMTSISKIAKAERNGAAHSSGEYGAISSAVHGAMFQCRRKKFDVRDVQRVASGQGKQLTTAQIAIALRRFERKGKVKIVERGAGRRPSKYSLVKEGSA